MERPAEAKRTCLPQTGSHCVALQSFEGEEPDKDVYKRLKNNTHTHLSVIYIHITIQSLLL